VKKLILICFIIFSFVLTGCSGFRQAVGTEKIELDEFAIVQKRKLVMPPVFNLNLKLEPIKIENSQAKEEMVSLFGVKMRNNLDQIDANFSKLFPLEKSTGDIRMIIDRETTQLQLDARTGIDILFNDNKVSNLGEILDADVEQKRLDMLLKK